MGHGGEDALAVGLGRDLRVQQQGVFEVEDRAPVLHGAEELAAAGGGDVVQHRQRIGRAEIVVEPGQQIAGRLQGELGLGRIALLGDHPNVDAGRSDRGAIELAQAEEQQVGRHLRRGPEPHHSLAVAEVLRGRDRHVAERHLAGRDRRLDAEGRLVERLIPGRDEAAGVRSLELGVEGALLAGLGLVVEGEQAGGLGVDLAGVVDGQDVLALRQGPIEREGGGLGLLVDLDLGRPNSGDLGLVEGQVCGLQDDRIGGLRHLDRNLHLAGEGQLVGVGRERHIIVRGADIARQLCRHGGEGGAPGPGALAGGRLLDRVGGERPAGGEQNHGSGRGGHETTHIRS